MKEEDERGRATLTAIPFLLLVVLVYFFASYPIRSIGSSKEEALISIFANQRSSE